MLSAELSGRFRVTAGGRVVLAACLRCSVPALNPDKIDDLLPFPTKRKRNRRSEKLLKLGALAPGGALDTPYGTTSPPPDRLVGPAG